MAKRRVMAPGDTLGSREAPAALRGVAAPWWEHRFAFLALVVIGAIPLLWPNIPPLVDLPGHLGRYRVQLDGEQSASLTAFFHFEWALIGNLGVDLLVIPLSHVFGLELAVKLIVLAIPPLTILGFLWVAREVHGWVPPTAFFAVPLAYNFPFLFGFANFALSMALALLAFAFWLRLARQGRLRLRAILFVPISAVIWVTHTFGWGTLGVMAFSAELVRQLDDRRNFFAAAFRAGIQCLSLVPPAFLMLAWRSGHVTGETSDWFNWEAKLSWVKMVLRDRWEYYDYAGLALIGVLLAESVRNRRLTFSRNLAASALFLLVTFICLPRIVFGSAYADMRLAPYVVAVAVLAVRFQPGASRRFGNAVAILGLLFVLVRLAGNTASFWMYDRDYDRVLTALDHVPKGARMVSFVGRDCNEGWRMSRLHHLPAMAMVRKEAYSNDQWSMQGAQLLTVKDHGLGFFAHDPSEVVIPNFCRSRAWLSIGNSLLLFPRDFFDYVWLIDPPAYEPWQAAGLQPIWRSGSSVLYRVVGPAGRPPAP